MPKKTAREMSHLRVRIEPKLLAKLEKSREKNGHTLTGEIVARLELSFEKEDRIALVRSAFSAFRTSWAEGVSSDWKWPEDVSSDRKSIRRESDEGHRSVLVVDLLLGGEKLKSAFLRSFALELANTPVRQLEDASSRRQVADRALAGLEKWVSQDGR